jgi:uncharacterized membrane protein YkvA (DUF1232 family)
MVNPRHTVPPEPRGFAGARKSAAALAENTARLADVLARATRKAARISGPLAGLRDDLWTLLRLLKAWAGRRYPEVSTATLVTVIAAVVYFVNPFDAIPDLLPMIGYVDDASVIAFVIARVRGEIERFRTWELQTEPRSSSLP